MRMSPTMRSYAMRTFCCISAASLPDLKTRLARSYSVRMPTNTITRIAVATRTSARENPRCRLRCFLGLIPSPLSERLDGIHNYFTPSARLGPAHEDANAQQLGGAKVRRVIDWTCSVHIRNENGRD